jgi:hypothetical protein
MVTPLYYITRSYKPGIRGQKTFSLRAGGAPFAMFVYLGMQIFDSTKNERKNGTKSPEEL